MASKTYKPYNYNKSPRLALIPEDFKNLISDNKRKKRDTPEPETFEESVKPPPLTIYTVDALKLGKDYSLTTWVFQSPPITEVHWKKVQPQVYDIHTFTQTLGYIHCIHPKDIQLLREATTKLSRGLY